MVHGTTLSFVIIAQRGAEGQSKNIITMNTVLCPNKLCGKEVSNKFEKCPFCGTPLHDVNKSVDQKQEKKAIFVERSGWHTYATIILILSFIALLSSVVLSLSEKNIGIFFIGLGEFILFSLFCGIVQLLAGIKQGIDNLLFK